MDRQQIINSQNFTTVFGGDNLQKTVVVVISLLLSGCSDLCGNEVVQKVTSPDKSTVATALLRSCGATTPFFTVITLSKMNDQKVLYLEEDVVFSAEGEINVQMNWLSANQLHIIARTSDPHKLQKKTWNSTHVSFN